MKVFVVCVRLIKKQLDKETPPQWLHEVVAVVVVISVRTLLFCLLPLESLLVLRWRLTDFGSNG